MLPKGGSGQLCQMLMAGQIKRGLRRKRQLSLATWMSRLILKEEFSRCGRDKQNVIRESLRKNERQETKGRRK